MADRYDAVVVGAGPNGLAAAIVLARAGLAVKVLEQASRPGGGTRTDELTLPGHRHDVCSAIHPFGRGSPAFRSMPLDRYGLAWIDPPVELAHPLDGGRAVTVTRSVAETAARLGDDASVYRRVFAPLARKADAFFEASLTPLWRIPRHPITMARFGLTGLSPGTRAFGLRTEAGRALAAGLAAHSMLPLEAVGTSAVGAALLVAAHAYRWPLARGGSAAITEAMVAYLESLGGVVETSRPVRSAADLPQARIILLSVTPPAFEALYRDQLAPVARRRLRRWKFGPGVFKIDWALDGPIPWANPEVGRAATVHVGGTLEEIAASERDAWNGKLNDRPFVLLAQPSLFDETRAPAGRHTVWGYCHVPSGSTADRTAVVEAQIERFAPGFRDLILARHVMNSADYETYNPNYVGGDIGGGAFTLRQMIARPRPGRVPYATPIPGVFLCGASCAPGPGVHGMSGWNAAHAALDALAEGRA